MFATQRPLPDDIIYSSMPGTAFKSEGTPSLIPIQRSESKEMSIPVVKPVRRVEFDEDSIKATSPIRKVKPTDIEIPTMRALHRSASEETIRPSSVKMRRSPSKDIISPAMDGTHPVRRSTSREESSPAMKGTHLLRKSTSKEKVSPSLRKMRSAISIRPAFPRAALKGLQPPAISLLRAMCFFEPTDIREDYLTSICAHYSSHRGGSEDTLSEFPVQPDDLLSTLDELMKEELISFPADSLGIRVKDEVRKEILNQLKSMPAVFVIAFETAVFVLHKLWPSMMGPQKRELDFDEYAKNNLWGGRNELVKHVKELVSLFERAKPDKRELCASRRYMVLLVEAAWYYFERADYREANEFVETALWTSELAYMVPRSLLANLYRTSAAIACELGHSDREHFEVGQFIQLYPEAFKQPDPAAVRDWRYGCPTAEWASTNNAILQSGLLAAAPDGIGLSPWGFDEVQGFPHLAPFLSLRYFGWMNYAEGRYDDAAKCFLQGMGDRKRAFGPNDSAGPRTGELLYALGVVREAQKNETESFNYFKRALAQFKKTDEGGPSEAKTHYKMALHYIHRLERNLAQLRRARRDNDLKLRDLKLAELEPAVLELKEQSLAELNLADEHLEAASAFYRYHGTNNEYAPHLARVALQTAQVQSIYGDPADEVNAVFRAACRYREKMVLDYARLHPEAVDIPLKNFDGEVVIWAR